MRKSLSQKRNSFLDDSDPLLVWFDTPSATYIRNLELVIYQLLVNVTGRPSSRLDTEKLSGLACFFYTGLFKVIRLLVKSKFSSSNPTWIKSPKSFEAKLTIDKISIAQKFSEATLNQVRLMELRTTPFSNTQVKTNTTFSTATSTKIPIEDSQIDLVLTSPPYCTRIDYAILTKPELAVIGFDMRKELKHLRNTMIGTPTVHTKLLIGDEKWGPACNTFLQHMSAHQSLASQSYYLKNHLQYFDSMYKSLLEVHRVLKVGGNAVIVVQDSYYKDLHNNLPLFITQIAENIGFQKNKQIDYAVTSMSVINAKSRKYGQYKSVHESVISLTR